MSFLTRITTKKNFVLFVLLNALNGFTQTPIHCNNYSSIGTDTSNTFTVLNPICNAEILGTISSGEAIWTGATCSGFIETTVTGAPVYCLSLSYDSVNSDDYATITTNTGGVLTITGVNVGVVGTTIGPYQCVGETGAWGKVSIVVCSTIPFSSVTLTNTGCASGWVVDCSPVNCDTVGVHSIPDVEACIGTQIELTTIGGVSYSWQTNSDINNTNIANPTITVNSSDSYIVEITNLFGCIIKDTVNVTALSPSICDSVIDIVPEEMANAFSPNNDNINDIWFIADIDLYPINTVLIYNRWGDLVRTINDYNNLENSWNGTDDKNRAVLSGTYFYVITYEDTSKNGWVEVVK